METCPNCQCECELTEDFCVVCAYFLGYPNVRIAKRQEEVSSLSERYEKARSEAEELGFIQKFEKIEEQIRKSVAVINVPFNYLYTFMMDDRQLYSNYYGLVDGEVRKAAKEEYDRQRRVVDSLLFGSYADKIRFGVLSLDGSGLTSYGNFAMRLSNFAIERRSSVLEENSFQFVRKLEIRLSKPIPTGHRAGWDERHKLAMCKIFSELEDPLDQEQYQSLLVKNTCDRQKDGFIEVHIYGPFNNKAVDSVKMQAVENNPAIQALIEELKEHLSKTGTRWEEP